MKKYIYVIFSILVVLGVGYWYYDKQNVVTNTDNWKTYRDDKYGFEFKYPSDLKNQLVSLGLPVSYPVYDEPYVKVYTEEETINESLINSKCTDKYWRQNGWKEIIIGGRSFCSLFVDSYLDVNYLFGQSYYKTIISHGGKNFEIDILLGRKGNQYSNYSDLDKLSVESVPNLKTGSEKIFKSILTTFKVIPE